MKFTVEHDSRVRKDILHYTLRNAHFHILMPLYLVIAVVLGYTYDISAAISFVVLLGLFIALYLWALSRTYGAIERTYADENGKIMWTYDITKTTATLGIGGKVTLEFERSGVKKVRLFPHAAFFKHKRSPFYIFFPRGKEDETTKKLRDLGWIR